MIEQRLQRRHQLILAQARRHLQQHRLVEALDRPAALGQPAHDRRRRQRADRDVGQRRAVAVRERPATAASAATV